MEAVTSVLFWLLLCGCSYFLPVLITSMWFRSLLCGGQCVVVDSSIQCSCGNFRVVAVTSVQLNVLPCDYGYFLEVAVTSMWSSPLSYGSGYFCVLTVTSVWL